MKRRSISSPGGEDPNHKRAQKVRDGENPETTKKFPSPANGRNRTQKGDDEFGGPSEAPPYAGKLEHDPKLEEVKIGAMPLLEGGADPHLPDLAGLFPIHMAAMHGHADVAATLIAAETSPNVETRNPGQATPIFFAAQFDRTALVKLLLGKGADIKLGRQFYRAGSGIERQPPLYAAFERTKDGATPTLLIERGARIDERFPMGDEPIHLAARRNLPKLIELLIVRGADINRLNMRKATALEVAAESGARDAVELLLKKGATVTPAAFAAARKKGNAAITGLLEMAGK